MALTAGTLLKRGLHRRCAVCGQKHLFTRWVVMAERCPRCGFKFERAPGQWLGSWFLNICLAQMLAILIVIAGVVVDYPHPPIVGLLVVGITAMIVFPVWFFPYSRTIWVAIDLAMTPLSLDEDVAPGFELGIDLEADRPRR